LTGNLLTPESKAIRVIFKDSAMRSDIVPGAVFPDYALTDHTGKRRKLSELQGQHPMVVVLSRGGFCPKDRRQHEGLVELHRELEVAYCRLVTISTDSIVETNEFRTGVGAHWTFLSTPGVWFRGSDIAEYTDPDHNTMIPHTVVLEPGRIIHKIYMGYCLRPTHGGRPAPGPACRSQEVPTRLGYRHARAKAAWQEGKKELFYPYGKSYAQSIGEQD
jgi:peroxiredoxin